MKSALSTHQTQAMFVHVSQGIVDSKDRLTQADKAIGDGDHGVGMARGFEAVRNKLQTQAYAALGELLNAIGFSLMTSVGGAAGAIFGTFFRGGAKNLNDQHVFDSVALSYLLLDGLSAIQERGGARPGDKTIVDALQPAALASRERTADPLFESLPAVTEAARQGVEKTKRLVAQVGKAKTLGNRSLGHADPGAISIYLILKFMAEYVTEMEDIG
jgi:dihydroxyacetone kinase-like protein